MSTDRQQQIEARRAQIPRQHRATYDRAMTGKSRKAATRVFCCECCGWELREVFLCRDVACPLYPYRPRSRASQRASESIPDKPESKKVRQVVPE
jgi:hypothetical protein